MNNCLECDHHKSGLSKDCEKCRLCGGSIKYNISQQSRKCEVEGCNNDHFGRGYCRKHYNKYIAAPRSKERRIEKKKNKIKLRRLCEIEGCFEEHYAKGRCQKHYYQKWRNENTNRHKTIKTKNKQTIINKKINVLDKKLKIGFSQYAIDNLKSKKIEYIMLSEAEKKFIGINGDVVIGRVVNRKGVDYQWK